MVRYQIFRFYRIIVKYVCNQKPVVAFFKHKIPGSILVHIEMNIMFSKF